MIKLKDIKYNILAVKYLVNEEKSFDSNLNFFRKFYYFLKGFSSDKYELYNFKSNDSKKYLSDFQRHKTHKINGPYSIILNDKSLFSKILSEKNITPSIYGRIIEGNIYLYNEKSNLQKLLLLLKNQKKLIIKKYAGGGAKGIYNIKYTKNILKLNNKTIDINEFSEFLNNLDNFLISECLNQTDYSNKIYPNTINSIRIIVMRDPKTKEFFIPIAVHKFGSKKTEPADNVWRGGLTASVDTKTGRLKQPALHLDNNKKIKWVSHHPDTKEVIKGVQIPNWDLVKEAIISFTNELNVLNYVGWDVVVQQDGIRIIEGNNYSDVNILQIHEPLLENERVRKFYKNYNIIK